MVVPVRMAGFHLMLYPGIEVSGVAGKAKAHAGNATDAMIISKTGSSKTSPLSVLAIVRRITTTGFAAVITAKSTQRLGKDGELPFTGARSANRTTYTLTVSVGIHRVIWLMRFVTLSTCPVWLIGWGSRACSSTTLVSAIVTRLIAGSPVLRYSTKESQRPEAADYDSTLAL